MIRHRLWKLTIAFFLIVNSFATANILDRLFGNGRFNFDIFNFGKRNEANPDNWRRVEIERGEDSNNVSTDEETTSTHGMITIQQASDYNDNHRANREASTTFGTATNSERRHPNMDSSNRRFLRESSVYDANALPPDMSVEEIMDTISLAENSRINNNNNNNARPTPSSRPNSRSSCWKFVKMKNWFRKTFDTSKLLRLVRNINFKRETTSNVQRPIVESQSVGPYSGPDYELECPICYEDLFSVETIVVQKCGHLFCKICGVNVFQYKRVKEKCPLCNQKWSREDLMVFHFPTCEDHAKTISLCERLFSKKAIRKFENLNFNQMAKSEEKKICYKPKCEKCLNDFSMTPNDPITVLGCGHFLCVGCSSEKQGPMFCPLCKTVQFKSRKVYYPKVVFPDT